MSDITALEKLKLEKFLNMGNGYVLDFNDRTFREFILENAHIDIQTDKYNYKSGSKANRLRAFFDLESNYVVGKLITDLLIYWKGKKVITETPISPTEQELHDDALRTSHRLKEESPVESVDAIQANTDDRDFVLLAKLIRESIEKNEPEPALDRLHTFVVKYIRELCNKHEIEYTTSESLNAIFGKYVRHITTQGLINSPMAEKILKYSIQILDAFNDVRNNRSFAHDNPILSYHESVLIFNNISSSIKFIDIIEQHMINQKQEVKPDWNDFGF